MTKPYKCLCRMLEGISHMIFNSVCMKPALLPEKKIKKNLEMVMLDENLIFAVWNK